MRRLRRGRGRTLLHRGRPGLTLLEALVTLLIASTMVLGLAVLVVEFRNQWVIEWELRDAEEFGLAYVNNFQRHVHNGRNVEIIRWTPPSELHVDYPIPGDALGRTESYQYEYNHRTGFPTIRVNGRRVDIDPSFPPKGDGRDRFYVPPSSFVIRPWNDSRDDQVKSIRDWMFEIQFSIVYTREPTFSFFGQQPFTRVLNFTSAGYEVNANWVVGGDDPLGESTGP